MVPMAQRTSHSSHGTHLYLLKIVHNRVSQSIGYDLAQKITEISKFIRKKEWCHSSKIEIF